MTLEPKPLRCQCPEAFHATILDTLPGNMRMTACLRCGATELADAIVDEPHPHDVQLLGFEIHDLTPEARAWASAWPRFIERNRPWIYVSAAERFETEAGLAAIATRQQDQGLRATLLSLGAPAEHPPESLPAELYGFREIWHGLQLNDDSPMEELLDAATRWNGPRQLAAEVLARRTDLEPWAAAMVSNFDERNRKWGRYMITQFHLTGPQVMAAIRCRLSEIPDDSAGEIAELGRVLRALGPAAASARPEVEAAAERIKDNYYSHKDLQELLAKWLD